jgi:hypothetical protein
LLGGFVGSHPITEFAKGMNTVQRKPWWRIRLAREINGAKACSAAALIVDIQVVPDEEYLVRRKV